MDGQGMRVKGICKDCAYRWQWGMKGKPQHLYCNLPGKERIVKNTGMKDCPNYEVASKEHLKALAARCLQRNNLSDLLKGNR